MKTLFTRSTLALRPRFNFSKQFIKDTTTQFQNEIGLTTKLKKMVKNSSSNENAAQKLLSVPFAIGVSCVVTFFFSMNSERRKNIIRTSELLFSLVFSNLCSAKFLQRWLLNSMDRYTSCVRTSNSPTFLYQMQIYLRRNGIKNVEDLAKINRILQYSSEMVKKVLIPKHKGLIIKIMEYGVLHPELKSSNGLRKLSEIILRTGDITSQYLALRLFSDLQISEEVISVFNRNLERFSQTKDIATQSYAYKSSLIKNQILFILHHIKTKKCTNVIIPQDIKTLYT